MENVNRNHHTRYFKLVEGNRAIHSVLSGSNATIIQICQLSCYCENCFEEDYKGCKNTKYVSGWKTEQLEMESCQKNRATRSEAAEMLISTKELLTKNTVVAIASGDPGEEYYLLKITGNGPEILEKRLKDGWGMSFPPGAEVVRRHFFVKQEEGTSLHSYYLEKGKVAVVYSATASSLYLSGASTSCNKQQRSYYTI